MKTIEWRDEVPREGWGAGPWDGEPDRVQWPTAAGLPGLARRTEYGNWCGYVAVPADHPLHGTAYSAVDGLGDGDPHGGLTYSGLCRGHICHEVEPGEPDGVWWFGFDCHHYDDFSPGYDLWFKQQGLGARGGRYRSLAYVRAEVERLARALAAVAP